MSLARWTGLTWWVAAAIIGYQVLTPPIVGQGDTGDMWPHMLPGGLGYSEPWDGAGARGAYAISEFQVREPRFTRDPDNEWNTPVASSETLVIYLARLIHGLFGKQPAMDVRYLGLVHLGLFLAGWRLCLDVAMRRCDPRAAFVTSALALWIFTDVGYVAYFNTAYGDAAILCFLPLTVGCALKVLDTADPRWFWAFVAAAALLLGAKAQNGPATLPLALLLMVLGGLAGLSRWRRFVGGLILVGAGTLAYTTGHVNHLRFSNIYSSIFTGILPFSEDRRATMAEFGLDPRLEKYIGKFYWGTTDGPRGDPVFEAAFAGRRDFTPILAHHLRHPAGFLALCRRAARQAFSLRVPYMGNFTRDSGMPPLAHSHAFSYWSSFKAKVLPNRIETVILWLGAAFVLSLFGLRSREREGPALSAIALALIAVAILQFVTAVMGDGLEAIARHLFFFNALSDLLLVGSIAGALNGWLSPRPLNSR